MSRNEKNKYGGFWKILKFTFVQRVKSAGYRAAIITGALLCFLLPVIIMACMEKFGGRKETENLVKTVYVVEKAMEEGNSPDVNEERAAGESAGAKEAVPDVNEEHAAGDAVEADWEVEKAQLAAAEDDSLSESVPVDYNILNSLGWEGYTEIRYYTSTDFEEAVKAVEGVENAVILVAECGETSERFNVVLPESSNLTKSDLSGFEAFIGNACKLIQMQRTGLEPEELAALTAPVAVSSHRTAEAKEDAMESLRETLSYAFPYMNIMVLYFMVLFYGQGVSSSVLMEKTSKLMDTMLLCARPGGMVLGKVIANAFAGIVQIFIWLAGLAGGSAAGTFVVKMINPDTEMLLIKFFETLGELGGLFTIPAVIAALIQIIGGFLLYCALAAIGGAVAGKQEELSTTNLLFTMALVVSFLFTLSYGGLGSMTPASRWLNWMPFSAVLVVPSRVLLGQISIWEAYGSLGVVLVTFVLISLLAGKLYQCMALYKGKLPKPGELVKMLKG